MDRQEAFAILHQINHECKETTIMTCVSLDSSNSELIKTGIGYQTKTKCDLDAYSRKCLNSILQRNIF